MQRAFVSKGQWETPLSVEHDATAHKRATLRVSALIGAGVLAAAMFTGFEAPPNTSVSTQLLRTNPEIVRILPKEDERIPLFGDITASATLRHARVTTTDIAAHIGSAMRGQLTLRDKHVFEPVREAEALEPHTLRLEGRIVRLAGILPPSADEMCRRLDGMQVSCIDRAMGYMDLLIKGRQLKCEQAAGRTGLQNGASQDGPPQAICRAGEADLAEAMVRQGWARADVLPEERFVLAQAAARKQKLGIWK